MTVPSRINLTISKDGPTTATQSDVTDYTIKVKNNAVNGKKQIATGVVVNDPMPVGLIPLTATAGDGNNWTCTIFQNPINLVQCLGDLAQAVTRRRGDDHDHGLHHGRDGTRARQRRVRRSGQHDHRVERAR